MKKLLSVLLSLAMLVSIGTVLNGVFTVSVSAAEATYTAQVWKRAEIVLKSTASYKNPYADVEVNAVFTHEDGTTISIPGFWYGDKEWHVRFAPTKTGTWTYQITSNQTGDTGLHKVSGTVQSTENTGTTELDKHGFIKLSSNSRYYTYADGTPFFWLGDTNWQAPNYVSTTKCNYPGCTCGNQFKHEVDNRVSKGFNIYQTYFDSAESDGGGQKGVSEPSIWAKKNTLPNTSVYNAKIDYMFEYLSEVGMTVALGFGVHANTMKNIKQDDYLRLVRYLVARYGAYSVVWITGQEITNEETSATAGKNVMEVYMEGAKLTDQLDGYDHPNGAHMYCLKYRDHRCQALDATDWHNSWILQSGHGRVLQTKQYYKEFYLNDFEHNKPYIESECNYEDIDCGGFTGYDANRYAAWKAVLCGSAGFTYGVTGIWANCYSNVNNTGWLGSFSYGPWYMGLDKPGGYEVGYMKQFFEKIRWWDLVARFDLGGFNDFASDEKKCMSSTEDAAVVVCYFCNSDTSTGTIQKLDKEKAYHALWFNPLTGHYREIADKIELTADGQYKIPQKPDEGDWVLLLTAEKLENYKVESPYQELATEGGNTVSGNMMTPASVSAVDGFYYRSGTTKPVDQTSALSDADPTTAWKPLDSRPTQTILYDLGSLCTLTSLVLTPTAGYFIPSYRIEASADGINWTILVNRTRTAPETIKAGTYEYVCENLAGNYRYVKVLLLNSEDVEKDKAVFKLSHDESTDCYYYTKSINDLAVYVSASGLDISQASGTVEEPGGQNAGQPGAVDPATVDEKQPATVAAVSILPATLILVGALAVGIVLAVVAVVIAKKKKASVQKTEE